MQAKHRKAVFLLAARGGGPATGFTPPGEQQIISSTRAGLTGTETRGHCGPRGWAQIRNSIALCLNPAEAPNLA
jgi:hypothetical protein